MKLKFIVQPKAGISYHRLINSMSYIQWDQGDSAEMIWIGEEQDLDCDILMYNKFCSTSVNDLRERQKQGMKIIVDVDDLWKLSPTHPNYEAWQRSRHDMRIAEHIKLADLVICTSMILQNKVRELNKNTVVIPNAFPYGKEMYRPMPESHEKFTFMYMGGSTHYQDVKLMEGKFKRIGSDPYIKSNAEFVLAGYEKGRAKRFMTQADKDADNQNFRMIEVRGEYDKMQSVFAHTGTYRVLPTTNLDEYINYYDRADVALCPLADTEWNKYKSVLKVAEAGAKEIPIICSKVEPYWPELRECPGILWMDDKVSILDHVRWGLKNRDEVKQLGKQLSEYCKENYELTQWNIVRKQVIRSLV